MKVNVMRELLFKNMTSLEKKRKTLSIQEVKQHNGLLTRINRKYIYILKSIKDTREAEATPQFYIFKECNSKKQNEKFLFKVKGSFHVINNQRTFLVYFCHSLRIALDNSPA